MTISLFAFSVIGFVSVAIQLLSNVEMQISRILPHSNDVICRFNGIHLSKASVLRYVVEVIGKCTTMLISKPVSPFFPRNGCPQLEELMVFETLVQPGSSSSLSFSVLASAQIEMATPNPSPTPLALADPSIAVAADSASDLLIQYVLPQPPVSRSGGRSAIVLDEQTSSHHASQFMPYSPLASAHSEFSFDHMSSARRPAHRFEPSFVSALDRDGFVDQSHELGVSTSPLSINTPSQNQQSLRFM